MAGLKYPQGVKLKLHCLGILQNFFWSMGTNPYGKVEMPLGVASKPLAPAVYPPVLAPRQNVMR
jgi:hypothetical protein